MKIQKIKKYLKLYMIPFMISFFIVGTAFGSVTSYIILSQSSSGLGSNNSTISFTGTIGKEGYYVNNGSNSSIIGNYFTGYYYDSLFGFFKLDWSINKDENVKIVDSTNKCSTGYGYKLGGKAYSEKSGYIDFDYSPTNFVYYCLDDGKLYGTAYGKYVGYQNFEGIALSLVNDIVDLTTTVTEDIFTNDTTNINIPNSEIPSYGGEINIGGDIYNIDAPKESIFYIIK